MIREATTLLVKGGAFVGFPGPDALPVGMFGGSWPFDVLEAVGIADGPPTEDGRGAEGPMGSGNEPDAEDATGGENELGAAGPEGIENGLEAAGADGSGDETDAGGAECCEDHATDEGWEEVVGAEAALEVLHAFEVAEDLTSEEDTQDCDGAEGAASCDDQADEGHGAALERTCEEACDRVHALDISDERIGTGMIVAPAEELGGAAEDG